MSDDLTTEAACRALLAAVAAALQVPHPATADGEAAYLRVSCDRATAAMYAIDMVLRMPASLPGGYAIAAGVLRARTAELPATGYQHTPPPAQEAARDGA